MSSKEFHMFDDADAVIVSGAGRVVVEASATLANSYPVQ